MQKKTIPIKGIPDLEVSPLQIKIVSERELIPAKSSNFKYLEESDTPSISQTEIEGIETSSKSRGRWILAGSGVALIIALLLALRFGISRGTKGPIAGKDKDDKVPDTKTPESTKEPNQLKNFKLSITGHSIFMNGEQVSLEALEPLLVEIKKINGAIDFLKDGEEPAGLINKVRELLRKTGVLYSERYKEGFPK